MSWLKENWFKVGSLIVLIVGVFVLAGYDKSETDKRWQAAYYPDGCLTCKDAYIYSPFFETVNECISWVHEKSATRSGHNDAAECSFNCQKSYDFGGIFVCDETVDVLGNPSL